MSDVRDPEFDQAAPIPNDSPYIQDLVVADINARKEHGIKKYGTALQAGNGRSMLLDAYEEALDLAIYLRGEIEQRNGLADLFSEHGDLRVAIFEALGEATVCWENPAGAGTFDSDQAREIGERLVALLKGALL